MHERSVSLHLTHTMALIPPSACRSEHAAESINHTRLAPSRVGRIICAGIVPGGTRWVSACTTAGAFFAPVQQITVCLRGCVCVCVCAWGR